MDWRKDSLNRTSKHGNDAQPAAPCWKHKHAKPPGCMYPTFLAAKLSHIIRAIPRVHWANELQTPQKRCRHHCRCWNEKQNIFIAHIYFVTSLPSKNVRFNFTTNNLPSSAATRIIWPTCARLCAFPSALSGDVKRVSCGVHALLEVRSAFWTGISSRALFSRSSLQ